MAKLVQAPLMAVDAIVVNYNAGESLQACVQSLFDSTIKPEVKVLDNASSDGSAENLRNLYGSFPGLQVLMNPENIGFARAVNSVAKDSTADFLLVINPDCILSQNALELMVGALNEDPEAALAAPAVYNTRGRLEKAAFRHFPNPWNSLLTISGLSRLGRWVPAFEGVAIDASKLPASNTRAEAVSGACMLIRRSAMQQLGFLDEAYGLHCEDLDLMYRLSEAGWFSVLVPSASAVHEQGVSSRSRPVWVLRQKHLGMARFFEKFQAPQHSFPVRWLVHGGIWLHFLVKLPIVLLRK
ncbi:MAG: glycosyltransferase family 2 protein [Xanthomonadales bacterium]|nr:glycosyltransferase family 2 protein [Gammaproteobacteria bacterium]NNE05636.1 glycosyltransferase family 2 protein [Xanthomonadales bacterium]NNL95563.1 glycosyltransferase family 2 protein [Xanthomonadales bacterium]